MKATMEEMKTEAIRRMNGWWKLHRNVINEFKTGKLNLSERFGALYWLNDEQKRIVDEWAKETGYVPYHVIHNMTEFGELLSILYVSSEKDEWKEDEAEALEGIQMAYVKNVSDNFCSEYGRIGVRPSFGGLVRTA